MFEEYLQDSYYFFEEGLESDNERKKKRNFRASVFYCYGSLEAYINFITHTLKSIKISNTNLKSKYDFYFLNDQRLFYDQNSLKIKSKTEYHSTEDKIKLLLRRYCKGFNFEGSDWYYLTELKKLRDNLVHPKDLDDDIPIEYYETEIKNGLSSVIKIINEISKGVFGKPLRQKLIDLVPESQS